MEQEASQVKQWTQKRHTQEGGSVGGNPGSRWTKRPPVPMGFSRDRGRDGKMLPSATLSGLHVGMCTVTVRFYTLEIVHKNGAAPEKTLPGCCTVQARWADGG